MAKREKIEWWRRREQLNTGMIPVWEEVSVGNTVYGTTPARLSGIIRKVEKISAF